MKLSKLKLNPSNPRIIKDDKFKKLVKSIKDFPEMMEKRPMVCVTDADGLLYPLGGNMRLKALIELKYKEIPDNWVMLADEWTEEKRNRFTISDNVSFGEWDWDTLANEWNVEELSEWGMDIPNFELDEEKDYSDKNKEIDTDEFSDKMTLKFEVSQDEYEYILSELQKINASKETALLTLLKYEP
jgi:ParB-like chromosome segregation protein Spo0J